MKRPNVEPAFIFGVSLVLSLLMWSPTLRGTMIGTVDITDAGIRFFSALALSWAGVYGISAIVAMYARRPPRPTPPPAERERRAPNAA
jgi:hypothetical protein